MEANAVIPERKQTTLGLYVTAKGPAAKPAAYPGKGQSATGVEPSKGIT